MTRKYVSTIVLAASLIAIVVSPVHARAADTSAGAQVTNETVSIFTSIGNFIIDHTPDSIKSSVSSAFEFTEDFRTGLEEELSEKQVNLESQIKTLNQETQSSWSNQQIWPKISTQIELFFTNGFYDIMASQLLFYGIIFLILLFMVRYIWRSIL